MAWGEGDEERIIARDLNDISNTVSSIRDRQIMNSGYGNYGGSGVGAGGAIYLILFIVAFPLVIVLHLLGVDESGGFLAAFISILWGIYLLVWGIFLWSFENPITMFLIAFPILVFAFAILYVLYLKVSDWIEDIRLRRQVKRQKKSANHMKKDSSNIRVVNQIIKVRCISCNELNNEDTNFCTKCGAKLKQ